MSTLDSFTFRVTYADEPPSQDFTAGQLLEANGSSSDAGRWILDEALVGDSKTFGGGAEPRFTLERLT